MFHVSKAHVAHQKILVYSHRMRKKQQELIALGQRIRKIRESRRISQEAFAEQAGISRSHYGCIERGQFALSLPKLIDIALALNVEVAALFPSLAELKKMSAPHDDACG